MHSQLGPRFRLIWRLACGGLALAALSVVLAALAGYLWEGPVRSIDASWRVPAIRGGPLSAGALTWIGVQTKAGSSMPFVQVGTWERKGLEFAFWSDTRHDFLPVFLRGVRAGDLVEASMTRVRGIWHLTFDDLTTHARETASSDEDRHARFELGEWFQEDPKNQTTNEALPYPRLSRVDIQNLDVNGIIPPYSRLYAQWMSLPGGDSLAPTPLINDQFSLGSAQVGRAGSAYLRDIAGVNTADSALVSVVRGWTSRTPTALAAAQSMPYERTYARDDRAQATQRWPFGIRRNILEAIAYQRAVIVDLRGIARVMPTRRASWEANLLHDVQRYAEVDHRIRRALRIPEFVPPG